MSDNLLKDHKYNLWLLLLQATDAAYNYREKELAKYGITTIESKTILTIKLIGENATPAKISRLLYRKPHTISTLLRRMENRGLITRTKDLEKRNHIHVRLTEKGEEAYEDSCTRESVHNLISVLSIPEQKQLWYTLEKLRDKAITDLREEYSFPFPPEFGPTDKD